MAESCPNRVQPVGYSDSMEYLESGREKIDVRFCLASCDVAGTKGRVSNTRQL